jgi:hypothetical protein
MRPEYILKSEKGIKYPVFIRPYPGMQEEVAGEAKRGAARSSRTSALLRSFKMTKSTLAVTPLEAISRALSRGNSFRPNATAVYAR